MASDQDKLSQVMRRDWNRRVEHDYRFWMVSDGYSSDAEMWETGERDLALALQDIGPTSDKSLLDLGCGVGRLLRAASTRFAQVTGVDVSDQAIERGRILLADYSSIDLLVGNGRDLRTITSESTDVVLSFAALTSMPTEIIGGYLTEIHRVLKPGGIARLQMYVGAPQKLSETNTLHLRCFTRANVERALTQAGFSIQWIRDLVLPFKASSSELGITAVMVSIAKTERAPADGLTLARLLLPEGELPDDAIGEQQITIVDLEYWMTLHYARELLSRGELLQARKTLDYAISSCRGATEEAQKAVNDLAQELVERERGAMRAHSVSDEFTERNVAILRERFPELVERLTGCGNFLPGIEVQPTPEGPSVFADGLCLDHPSKPVSAGVAWAQRTLKEERAKSAEHLVVFGVGGGYHIDALLSATDKSVSIIEPRPEALWAAIRSRDMSALLRGVRGISVGEEAPPFLDHSAELIVRPQAQVVAGEVCARLRAASYGKRGFATLHPRIAVLGPLQGGTLPMVQYTARALGALGQRGRAIDVSGFAGGYHCVEDFITDRVRKAVVQNAYLESISQMILESFAEKPFDILLCMAQAPISGRVLAELRTKGVITVLWFVEDYKRFTYWREMSRYYDFVFTIQPGECIESIKAAGAGEVHYLPTACDPEVHRPLELTQEERARWGSPISFVGAGYHNRQQLLASLAHLPFKIWGTEWPGCRPFDRLVQEEGRRLSPAEYVKIFNGTEVNINLHSSSERDGVDPYGDFLNPRTFELAACGAFQLVDERSLLADAFVPDEEIVTFKNAAELKEKIKFYLDHPEARERIAAKARERVLRDHTYTHRLKEMLSIIYTSRFEQLKRREDESPWHKLLERSKKFPELHNRCRKAFERGEEANLDGLVSDVITGKGKLSETEQILMFLYHIRRQTLRMRAEEAGEKS